MSHKELLLSTLEQDAIRKESEKFKKYYLWIKQAMPALFFEEVSQENVMLVAHNLMGFDLQEYFSTIHVKNAAIAMCLDSADADLRILKNYTMHGIKTYQAYISKIPPPFPGITANLRIVAIYFTEATEISEHPAELPSKQKLRKLVKLRNPAVTDQEFETLLAGIDVRLLRALPTERLILALDMFFRAKTRDNCQYEVRYEEDWEKTNSASMQIVLAWRNTHKHNFLYRLARTIHRHGLVMKRVNASYINPYSKDSVLVMALGLHGSNGKAVWEVADIPDFLRELITVKYFASFDTIEEQLVTPCVISGNMGNLLRAMVSFIHQALVHIDVNIYSVDHIVDGLCRHPELTRQLCRAFEYRFNIFMHDEEKYKQMRLQLLLDINKLDTGHEENDRRRQNVLRQGMSFIHHTLKTNFYNPNYTALSFRLDPHYLDEIPFDRSSKFPELPFAIIFITGMNFFGFHIRFKDLARGGLRTVLPENEERMQLERNTVFTECYNLALTQHMKNKDIPEGGAKGIIFLKPYDPLETEVNILKNELQLSDSTSTSNPENIERQLKAFREEHRSEYLRQAQRAFVTSIITLVNCHPDGRLLKKNIVDYWKRPEYIYLGPDENMHDDMIQWIAEYALKKHYKPGSAFISGKPLGGINHKEYGVTSLGINVYMHALLQYIDINPTRDIFTVKMSGGPDGDVAGNQICNLQRLYPHTAKIIALTDATGTIYDALGLDLSALVTLFNRREGIKFYPVEKLSEGGFLVDKWNKRSPAPFVQQTLCWRIKEGQLVQDWLSGNDMNHLLRNNVHQTKADVFIPAGGRPRTLNESNYTDFLDERGEPTARIIIEGANLYLTQNARRALEKKGVLVVKDSSANKTGVICSSFEVLCGLALGIDLFVANKNELIDEILKRLQDCARREAELLLRTHKETGQYLTEISSLISLRINQCNDQLLEHLNRNPLPDDPKSPIIKCFLDYCLPLLRKKYKKELLHEIPEQHKKAIIACHIAAQLVYEKGLSWSPSIIDLLPVLLDKP